MQDKDGKKRHGRFLKKDSKTLESVKITKFDFAEISEANMVIPDNPNLNIIHSKLHYPDELSYIKESPIDETLVDRKSKLPIMTLRDFTRDWIEYKNKIKNRRNKNMDDDEDIESIFNEKSMEKQQKGETTASKIIESPININQSFDPRPGQKISPENFDIKQQEYATDTSDSDDQATTNQLSEMESSDYMDAPEDQIEHENQLAATENQLDHNEDFVQISSPHMEEDQVADVEKHAINEYQRQSEIKSIDVETIKKEARAVGYEDGFRIGEEKSTIAIQQQSQEMFEKVSLLMDEFQNLKKEILDNVQENFQEIAVAMCEAIIERSVNLDPSILANIMQRAISESVDEENFKIRVNPETTKILENLHINGISNRLVSDEKVPPGDFKIETALGSVNSGIKKIIGNLMAEADLQIFESDDNNIEKTG